MSNDEDFNPWRWDRDNARVGRARLTVERHGHKVSLDHRGLSIDGRRIIHDDLTKDPDHKFEVRPDGTVMYREKEVAAITEPEGWTPGVTVWGKNGPNNRELQEREEAERQRRDQGHRAAQQQEIDRDREGQEIAL